MKVLQYISFIALGMDMDSVVLEKFEKFRT